MRVVEGSIDVAMRECAALLQTARAMSSHATRPPTRFKVDDLSRFTVCRASMEMIMSTARAMDTAMFTRRRVPMSQICSGSTRGPSYVRRA